MIQLKSPSLETASDNSPLTHLRAVFTSTETVVNTIYKTGFNDYILANGNNDPISLHNTPSHNHALPHHV